MSEGVDAALREQAVANRGTSAWSDLYAGHRARLTAAIAALAPTTGAGRLCLLGAGNCQDVDLETLCTSFRQIHLVDLDASALARAWERQSAPVRERLSRQAPVDLSGMLALSDRWRKTSPSLAELDAAVGPATEGILKGLPKAFDVSVSCCVMTQMTRAFALSLGHEHPRLEGIRRVITTVHLRTLLGSLAARGRAMLVSDLVSSETYPLEDLPPETDLAAIVPTLVPVSNFFFGADPRLHAQIMRRDPVLALEAGPTRPVVPWLWKARPDVTFLVYGFTFDRKS